MRTVDPVPDPARSNGPPGRTQRGAGADASLRRNARTLSEVIDVSDGWETAALCRDEDPTLFFGPNRFEPKHERMEREAEAKTVCAACPVLPSCRDHALRGAELYGVWGGLGESDRRALLAANERVARAV